MKKLLSFAATAAISLGVSVMAHAATISGSVYVLGTPPLYDLGILPLDGVPNGALLGTFTVNQINFSSYGNTTMAGSPSTDYTIGSFLTSLGATVTAPGNGFTANAGNSLLNTEFVFTGLIAPGTYTITHDDGADLFIGSATDCGSNPQGFCSPFFTPPTGNTFTVTGTTPQAFKLYYAESVGAPAVLTAPGVGVSPVPEPSSLVLLGTGILGLAGAARRRLMQS